MNLQANDETQSFSDFSEAVTALWTFSSLGDFSRSTLNSLGDDELAALSMVLVISSHFDQFYPDGVIEAGQEYFAQSDKADFLLGRVARSNLRKSIHAFGSRGQAYPLAEVTIQELVLRAKRAEALLSKFDFREFDFEDFYLPTDPIDLARSLNDDELVDCFFVSLILKWLKAIRHEQNFMFHAFSDSQLGLGEALETLKNELKSRTAVNPYFVRDI